MSDQVRVGVIGTSWWVDLMHLPSLKSHPAANIAALCGRNRERAAEMAQKHGIPRVFTDYREMIEQGNLDAVVVATPYDLHYPMTMDALDAGLHVLCEKPLALNAGQAREMTERAELAGVKHMVLFTWRLTPYLQYVRHLIDEDYIGRCFHVQMRFLEGGGRSGQYKWKYDQQRATGTLGGLGSHMIDFACWAIGDIARVSAHLSTFIDRPAADGQPYQPANDSALLSLEFQNGAQGMIYVSNVTHVGDRGGELHITLHGESGTLEVDFIGGGSEAGTTIRGARHSEESFRTVSIPDHFWGEARQSTPLNELVEVFTKQAVGPRLFVDGILEDRAVAPSFHDGLRVQEVIDAAIESDRQGCWVSLE